MEHVRFNLSRSKFRFIYLPSDGPNGLTAVHKRCPHRRGFSRCGKWFDELTVYLAHSFPNPIPDGTRVPHWALLDITVRLYQFVF